jgi:hypothetical protein
VPKTELLARGKEVGRARKALVFVLSYRRLRILAADKGH